MLAAERQNTERLLGAISESINRELPLRMQDVLARQLSGFADSLGKSLAPVVAAAVAQALPPVRPHTLKCIHRGLAAAAQLAFARTIMKPDGRNTPGDLLC